MEDIIQQLYTIMNEIQWGIERGKDIRLSKHDYRMILLVMKGYLELRKELLNTKHINREDYIIKTPEYDKRMF